MRYDKPECNKDLILSYLRQISLQNMDIAQFEIDLAGSF